MERRIIGLLLVAAMAMAGFAYGINLGGDVAWKTTPLADGEMNVPALSTEGYVKPAVEMSDYSTQLTYKCRTLTLLMIPEQTKSIALGVKKFRMERPNAHDLIQDIMDTFDMKLLMVKVERVENQTFYADMLIRQGNRLLQLDSRPSDAIAVAMRASSAIYVNESLFLDYGTDVC